MNKGELLTYGLFEDLGGKLVRQGSLTVARKISYELQAILWIVTEGCIVGFCLCRGHIMGLTWVVIYIIHIYIYVYTP